MYADEIKQGIKLLTPETFYINDYVLISYNGKQYRRRVYDSKVDLYFIFKSYKFFKYDFI